MHPRTLREPQASVQAYCADVVGKGVEEGRFAARQDPIGNDP